jgi:hypothetical protein
MTTPQQFSLSIEKFVAKAGANIDAVIKKVSLDMFRSIVLMSPVDTGRFRANWQIQIDAVPRGTLQLDDKLGTATITREAAKLAGVRAGDVVYFANNLPYAIPLEYGHSKQAPGGMVRLTVQRFQTLVDAAAQAVNK